MESRIKGSIVGLLIGDALGYPFSGKKVPPQKIQFIEGPHGEKPGTYHASGLALCTISSINDCHGISPEDIIERFNDLVIAGYLASEDCSDISETTVMAIKNFNNGYPPDRCGIKEGNNGECLIRILPVALECVNLTVDDIINRAHQVCELTHAQTISKVTCAIYCLIIRTILLQQPGKVFDLLEDYYKTKKMPEYIQAIEDLKKWKNGDIILHEADAAESVADCFWSAWAAYSQFEDNFELCLKSAISLGNDANATGAVAGSLSGLSNGIEGIPAAWLKTICLTPEAMSVISVFTESVVSKIK